MNKRRDRWANSELCEGEWELNREKKVYACVCVCVCVCIATT